MLLPPAKLQISIFPNIWQNISYLSSEAETCYFKCVFQNTLNGSTIVFSNSFHLKNFFAISLLSKPFTYHRPVLLLCHTLPSIPQNPFLSLSARIYTPTSTPFLLNDFHCHSLAFSAAFAHSDAFQSSAIIPAFQAGPAVRKFSPLQ